MMRKYSLPLLLLVAAAIAAAGDSLVVSFVDGSADVQPKGRTTWSALAIGDTVAADAVVRLRDKAMLELSYGRVRINLIKDGTYAAADLVKNAKPTTGTGLGATIVQKLSALTTERKTDSAALGTRGPYKGQDGSQIVWVDEAMETIIRVKELFSAGQYRDAVPLLAAAIEEYSGEAEADEFRFLLASAYAGDGQTVRAWKIVAGLKADPGTSFWPQYLVLKGQLQADALLWNDALQTLGSLLEPLARDEYGQGACLVAYFCYQGLGQAENAQRIAAVGRDIDPASDAGKQLAQFAGK